MYSIEIGKKDLMLAEQEFFLEHMSNKTQFTLSTGRSRYGKVDSSLQFRHLLKYFFTVLTRPRIMISVTISLASA